MLDLPWIVAAVAIAVAAWIVPGIAVRGKEWVALAVSAIVLGLVNALVRPVLHLLTLPITLLTLGLFFFVINALTLLWPVGSPPISSGWGWSSTDSGPRWWARR